MTFTLLLILTYMLALTPVFARGWALLFLGFALFAIAELLLGWLFFSEVQKSDFDDGASVMLAGGLAFLPLAVFAIAVLARLIALAINTLIVKNKSR